MSSDLTLDLSTLDGVRAAVQVAAAAAAATLPLPATVEELFDEQTAAALLPEDGPGRAVSVNVRGAATGTLVLVVAASLATAWRTARSASRSCWQRSGPALATPPRHSSPAPRRRCARGAHEISPSIALSGVGDGRLFAAVPLTSGGEPPSPPSRSSRAGDGCPARAAGRRSRAAGAATPRHEFQALTAAAGPGRLRPARPAARRRDGCHRRARPHPHDGPRPAALTPGSVVELDRAAGSPVDVLVNGTLIARGEVVVIDEEFGIRISEIIGTRPTATAPRR
jgi:flagellar motor switch protein FliN/FliY